MKGSAATLRLAQTVKYAALYIRVSTADQGERYSPVSQKTKLLAKAAADGYEVRPEHIFIDKHTGKESERPEFDKLRALVKKGAVQAVLALGVDRLARKVADAAIFAAEFKRYGAILDFVEMRNDDSPEGRLMFHQLASIAEYMGEKIVEKGRDGQMRMVDDNRVPGGSVIFGHDRHPTEKGRRIKNEREAAYVVQMCHRIDEGESSYEVAAWLNGQGVRGKGHNGDPPALWSSKTVLQLLRNRALIGECHTRGKIVAVPRIVSDALFYRVQKRLTENAAKMAGRPPGESLLSGFLRDEYDHRMQRVSSGDGAIRYYRCGHKTNKPPQKRLCDFPHVRGEAIEAPVFSMIWKAVTDPAELMRGARAYFRSLPQPERGSVTRIERELETVKRAYNNIRRMCDSGHYEFEEKKSELDAQKRQIASLEAELHAVAPVLKMPDEQAVKALMRRADTTEEPVSFAKRRAILDDLIDLRVTYFRSGEFIITGKRPFGPDAKGVPNCDSGQGAYLSSIPFYLKGRAA